MFERLFGRWEQGYGRNKVDLNRQPCKNGEKKNKQTTKHQTEQQTQDNGKY